MPDDFTAAIHSALLRVASNVAKHLIQRDGFSEDDKCFQIDLRESEQELQQCFAGVVAERDKLAVAIRDSGYGILQTSAGWSIHDVSERAQEEERRTEAVVVENAELTAERDRLAAAIREHRDQKADDRCHLDDQKLYAALNDGNLGDNRVGDPAAMLENCRLFIATRCAGGHWPTYQELEAALTSLRALLSRWRWGCHPHGCACELCRETEGAIGNSPSPPLG